MESFKFIVNCDEFEIIRYAQSFILDSNEFIYEGLCDERNNKLDLTIPFGITNFIYNSYEFSIEHKQYPEIKGLQNDTVKHTELFVNVTCENTNKACELFKKFIDEANDYCKDKKDTHVSIHTYIASIGWSKQSNLHKRNMDSIYINQKDKEKVINDIKNFFENKDRYIKFGVPYKRVYLFEGPPGTGKTSFIFALASLFNKNLSTITFDRKIDDSMFACAMRNLSNDSMLLLEDIDALFIDRVSSGNLSFSAMLNTLDGVGRREGQIIFMTTNHIENLDKALKRPGRVDFILNFGHPSVEQIRTMFDTYFPNQKNKFKEFYAFISQDKVTIALLQKFLFDNLDCDDIITKLPDLTDIINAYKKLESQLYS